MKHLDVPGKQESTPRRQSVSEGIKRVFSFPNSRPGSRPQSPTPQHENDEAGAGTRNSKMVPQWTEITNSTGDSDSRFNDSTVKHKIKIILKNIEKKNEKEELTEKFKLYHSDEFPARLKVAIKPEVEQDQSEGNCLITRCADLDDNDELVEVLGSMGGAVLYE